MHVGPVHTSSRLDGYWVAQDTSAHVRIQYLHGPWPNQSMVGYLDPRSNHYMLRYLGPGLTNTCKEIWVLEPAHHGVSGPGARKGSRSLGP
jgi:hypothetical protein